MIVASGSVGSGSSGFSCACRRRLASRAAPRPHSARLKSSLGWIVIAVTGLFVAFNFERARVWFFGIRVEMPLGLVVIASSLLGAVACYAFTSLKRRG